MIPASETAGAGCRLVLAQLALPHPRCVCAQDGAAERSKGTRLKSTQPPASLPSMTVWACCTSANFWLLFVIFGVGTGCGLMFVNSLGAHAQQSALLLQPCCLSAAARSLEGRGLEWEVCRMPWRIPGPAACGAQSMQRAQGVCCRGVERCCGAAGQLVESIGATQQGPDVLVSLFSIASAAGRLACGSVPDHFLQAHAIPRQGAAAAWLFWGRSPVALPAHWRTAAASDSRLGCARRTLFLSGVAGLTAAAAALASTSKVALLWAAAPAAGFAFGCHWSLMPPLAGEVMRIVEQAFLTAPVAPPKLVVSHGACPLCLQALCAAWVLRRVKRSLGLQLFGMRSFATLYCLLTFSTTFGTYALATRLVRSAFSLTALVICRCRCGECHSCHGFRGSGEPWCRPEDCTSGERGCTGTRRTCALERIASGSPSSSPPHWSWVYCACHPCCIVGRAACTLGCLRMLQIPRRWRERLLTSHC